MTRKFGLFVCFFCFGFALIAQNEDCPIAHDLVDTPTNLSNGFILNVDPLTGPGSDDEVFDIFCLGPPDEDMNGPIANTSLPYGSPEDKSFWFSFKAATSGTFEMIITPDNLEGDFDFMIWEGDCPSNPCSVPLFCGWQPSDLEPLPDGSIVEVASPTGLSSDMALDASSTQIWAPITLKENTNYFVLLDHRRPLFNPIFPDIGCEVVFGGTVIIEPTKEAPRLEPIFPPDISQTVPICIGTSASFEIDLLNFDETVDYIWETPSGNIFPTTQEEQNFLIQQSGQVCVQIGCPIQDTICWNVEIVQPPQLRAITPIATSCDSLTLEDYIEDLNMVPGFFDLLDENFQVIDIANINIRGEYTIRKTNGACNDSERITTTPPFPKLVATGFGTCDGPQFDLTSIIPQIEEVNGFKDIGNLDIFFYEDSLQAVNDVSPITITNGFRKYWARGVNDNDCFDVVSINIFDATPDIASPIIPAACNQLDLTSILLRTASDIPIDQSQIRYFENITAVNDPSNALSNPIVNSSGTYYAQVTINATCSTTIPLNVVINQTPTIDPVMDIDFCTNFDLEDVNLVEINGTAITRTYFNSEANANNNTTDLSINSVINTADTYYIRGTDPTSNCFSVVSVTLNTNEPTINPVANINECGDAYDLNTILPNLTEATGTTLNYSFYETAAEAEAGTTIGLSNITASNTYYIRGENTAITTSSCFDVVPVTITLTSPNLLVDGPFKIRDDEFDLREASIINLDNGQSIVGEGFYRDTFLMDPLPSSVVTVEGTYWVEVIVAGCSVSRPIVVRPASNATFPQETLDFEFPCVRADGLNLSLLLSGTPNGVDTDNFDIAFFTNEEDAEKGINAIPDMDLFIQEEGSIWVRKSDKTDNNIFGLIELVITERAIAEGGIVSMDQEICAEDVLVFQFTGSAPFDVRYTDGIDTFDLLIPSADILEEMVSPTNETTYEIVTFKDSHGCDGLLVDNTPTFTPVSISITDPVTICDDQETTYIVSFDIISGDLATLSIDGGALVGSRFTSDPILITDTYSFMVTDVNHSALGECDPLVVDSDELPVCTCDTEAAVMDQRTITACVGETITAIVDRPAVIADNNDRTVYVLHDSDNELLGNIIDINNAEPSFTFTADLAGNRYYISAVTTRVTDLLQTPALQLTENRCLAVAPGTPVEVRAIPSVTITLSQDRSCFGESVDLTFDMPETGPYNISFFDGNTTTDLTNVQNGAIRSVSAEMTTTFEVTSISYSDFSTCVNDMPEAMATLEIFEPITILNTMEDCEEDGETFKVSFEIVGGDPTTYTVNGSSANINGNLFESDFITNETNYQFLVSDGNGCLPAEVSDFGKCDCTSDITATIEIVQAISCSAESDAILSVSGNNGELPYRFEWSTGSITEQVDGLGEGIIFVSMTDANLCEVIDSIELTSPDPITAMVSTTDPSCSDLENGSIVINNVQGGTRPYSYTLDGGDMKSVGLFANLGGNDYVVAIEDSRGCPFEETTNITAPPALNIWFSQPGFNIVFGDSLDLRVNANEDSLTYAWQSHPSLSCTNCPSPLARPTETTNYSVTVTNQNDCTISRDILVQVDNNKGIFSPTAFSPNGDGINDTFGIFGGSQVREIVRVQIFNRWGALLYSRTNLPITDNFEDGWNGNETNGEKAPTGIYIFVAEIIYKDNTSEVVTGDVALMR